MANKKTEKVYENIVYVVFICVFSYLMKVAVSAKAFKVNGMKSMTFPKGIIAVMIILCSAKLILNIIQAVRQHNEAGESPLKYTNSVEFAILNGKSSTSTVDVYVGNKELSGNLF